METTTNASTGEAADLPRHPEDPGISIVRVTISILMFIHGAFRIYDGGVVPFGEKFLSEHWGLPFGLAIAMGITAFEIIGTLVLLARRFVIPIAAIFAFQLSMGIVMVHWKFGWFVVGGGTNGMEYSVLLILGFIAVAVGNRKT